MFINMENEKHSLKLYFKKPSNYLIPKDSFIIIKMPKS